MICLLTSSNVSLVNVRTRMFDGSYDVTYDDSTRLSFERCPKTNSASTMASKLTSLKDLKVLKYQIPQHGLVPNTSIQQKPLMIYKSAFPSSTNASQIESHLSSVGVVTPQWRFTMYNFDHFHSTSHEVLGIAAGKAKLCFGHEENPKCVQEILEKGDVIIMPAGVSHRLLEDLSGGFSMVGCYPTGCNWDMCYGKKGEESKVEQIKDVKWFTKDPVYGEEGPTLEV